MPTDAERFIQTLPIPLDPAAADGLCRGACLAYLDSHPLREHEWLALILLAGHLRNLRPPVWPQPIKVYNVLGERVPPRFDQRAQSLVTTVCLRALPEQLRPTVQHVEVRELDQ